jgi:CRISPR-associated protein Cpf1
LIRLSVNTNFLKLGKYELSKTLRFELKPVGKTADLLKQNKVFEKDKLIDDNYHKIKYYFDLLHRKFIKEALTGIIFDFSDYYKNFLALKKDDKTSKTNFGNSEEVLRVLQLILTILTIAVGIFTATKPKIPLLPTALSMKICGGFAIIKEALKIKNPSMKKSV